MSAILDVEQNIQVGTATMIFSASQSTSYAAVFEDDGETGYFYGLDNSLGESPIVDALHIYNTAQITDKHLPSSVKIYWSSDRLKTVLMINDYPHAVIDFASKRAYCRTNFPPPPKGWTNHGHEWDDRAMEHFR